MAFCSECGVPNRDATKFCTTCGVATVHFDSNSINNDQNFNASEIGTKSRKAPPILAQSTAQLAATNSKSNILIYVAIGILFFIAQSSIWIYKQLQVKAHPIQSTPFAEERSKLNNKNISIQKKSNNKNSTKVANSTKLTINYNRTSTKKKPQESAIITKEAKVNKPPILASQPYPAPSIEYVTSPVMKEVLKKLPATSHESSDAENSAMSENWFQLFIYNVTNHGGPSSCSDAQRAMNQCNY